MDDWRAWIHDPDGDRVARGEVDRRAFAALALGAGGYALAAQPVSAQAITTDAEGLQAGEIALPTFDGSLRAYLARPASPGPHPAVIVVNEIFGLHAYIQDVCRRLAKEGYVALAPGYFERVADPSQAEDFDAVREIVRQAGLEQVMRDTDAARSWLDDDTDVDADRLAITGFCWGGAVVWMYAAREARLKAGVAWYGRLRGRSGGPDRPWPLDVAADLKAPVLGLYGGRDRGIPLEDVASMRSALTGGPSEIVVYDDAQHGFHADYRPSYDPAAATDGWSRMGAWFRANGV